MGLSAQEAIEIVENSGLVAHIKGSGYVVSQSIKPGSAYEAGQEITLTLRY